jgi:hypothetical protein
MVLEVQPSTQVMRSSEAVHDRGGEMESNTGEVKGLKLLAYRQIKRFSHARNKEAIRRFVGEGVDLSGPSVLEIPLSVHHLINRGVSHFTGRATAE